MLSESKFSKYLLYAIGEIVLVVVGILIALQINTWNNNKIEDRKENRILLQLKDGLIADKEVIETELKNLEQVQNSIKLLDGLLNDPVLEYDKSMDTLFGKVYGIRNIQLNKAFYEDLKSSGIQLIKNDDIKTKVVSLYENNYGQILSLINMEFHINEVTRPYYLKNFQQIEFGKSAQPLDFSFIWKDPQYKNIVDYRHKTIETNHINFFSSTIVEIQSLLDDIDAYLNIK
jgi:hypothetical protein